MKILSSLSMLVMAFLLIGAAGARTPSVTDPDAARSLPAEGPVSVRWTDPAEFSEIRYSHNRWEARRGDWVRSLAEYLQTRAARRLSPGQRLDVTITDIRRAGNYEPWRGPQAQSVRIVRDIYPPRIRLSFKLSDADGRVVSEGDRTLTDLAFLLHSSQINDSDPLRHEKRLLDDWMKRDLAPAGA